MFPYEDFYGAAGSLPEIISIRDNSFSTYAKFSEKLSVTPENHRFSDILMGYRKRSEWV